MALKKETIAKLKGFGLDVDALIAAIKADDEKDYTIPDVTVLTTEQLTERDNNMKKEGEKGAEATVRATLVKELGKKLNVEFKSERIGDLATEIQQFTNKSGDEKVTLLQQQVTALTADKAALTQQVEQERTKAELAADDADLISYFPANRGADLSDSDRLSIIKANLQFETVDGKKVVKRNGEVLLDPTTRAVRSRKDVIADFFKEKPSLVGVVTTPPGGGRGGGDTGAGGSGGVGIKTMSKAKEQWLQDNPGGNVVSPEFNDYVGKIAAENTDFNWYE